MCRQRQPGTQNKDTWWIKCRSFACRLIPTRLQLFLLQTRSEKDQQLKGTELSMCCKRPSYYKCQHVWQRCSPTRFLSLPLTLVLIILMLLLLDSSLMFCTLLLSALSESVNNSCRPNLVFPRDATARLRLSYLHGSFSLDHSSCVHNTTSTNAFMSTTSHYSFAKFRSGTSSLVNRDARHKAGSSTSAEPNSCKDSSACASLSLP